MKFLMICVWLLLASSFNGYEVSEFVTELSHAIQVRTEVMYCFEMEELCETILRRTETNKILFTRPSNVQLRIGFDQDFLSIVLLQRNLSQPMADTLLQTLHKLRQLDVLFIVEAPIGEMEKWRWLFAWCWQNGFRNVLLLNLNGVLLSYEHLPISCIVITTLDAYLGKRNNWRKGSLNGDTLRVGSIDNPPHSVLYTAQRGSTIFTGEKAKVLKLFADHFQITLNVTRFAKNTLNWCTDALYANKMDLCGQTAFGNENHTIVYPYSILYGELLVPTAQPISKYKRFLAPFKPSVWILIVFSLCYATIALSLISWLKMRRANMSHYFLVALSGMLYLDFSLPNLRGARRCYVASLLLITGFIISNFYLTLLSSLLTTDLFGGEILDINDLRARNIRLLITDGSENVFKVGNSTLQHYELKHSVSLNKLNTNTQQLNPAYAYFANADKAKFYLQQQKYLLRPRMKALQRPVAAFYVNIPMANSWPFKDLLNDFYIRIFEYGLNKHIDSDVMYEAVQLGKLTYFGTEYYIVAPLSMAYFEMPAILLAFGYSAALLAFLLERLLHVAVSST